MCASKTSMAALHSNPATLDERAIALIGAGGHARETLLLLQQCGVASERIAGFFVDGEYWTGELIEGYPQHRLNTFDPSIHAAVVAVGDSKARRRLTLALPAGTCFPSFAHPTAIIPEYLELSEGVIVHASCIVTTNVKLERHVQLNRSTNVGHDSVLREFVTTAPGAVISGNCEIGAASYLGAMCCIREKQSVGEEAVIGMGAMVVSDVPAHAVFVGNPARPLALKSK